MHATHENWSETQQVTVLSTGSRLRIQLLVAIPDNTLPKTFQPSDEGSPHALHPMYRAPFSHRPWISLPASVAAAPTLDTSVKSQLSGVAFQLWTPTPCLFFKPMTRFETLKSLASLSPAAVLTRHTLVLERKKKKNRLIRARRCRSTKKSAKPHYPAYRELESWSRPCIIQPVQMHNKVSTFIYPLISLMFQLLLSDVWKCWRFVQLPT